MIFLAYSHTLQPSLLDTNMEVVRLGCRLSVTPTKAMEMLWKALKPQAASLRIRSCNLIIYAAFAIIVAIGTPRADELDSFS